MSAVPRLHVITDDDILRSPDFLARATDVVAALGPLGALHLRGHGTPARILYDLAAALAGPQLIINDRVDIALAVGAFGVQVGERALSVEDVRRVAPQVQIGESVHAAAPSSADWVIVGHIFDTPSHAGEKPQGLALVRAAVARAGVPVIAIGGVKVSDVEALQRAGAHGVAIVRGVWHAADSAQAVRDYLYFFA